MSKQQGKSNVADDAARARKLLDKHAPVKVSGLNKGNYTLQQGVNQNLGEHAVIVIVSEQTVHQYTISHPIGVTDGDEKLDWAINSTEYIPSMMARKVDPALGALNQQRAQLRTQLAVDAHLLTEKEEGGKRVHFYPNRVDVTRNELLNEARERLKEEQRQLRDNIEQQSDKAEQSRLRVALAQLTDPTEYLDEATAASEANLREFWQSKEVQEVIEFECPQLYRTLTGPYADQPQVIIDGVKGKSLDTVVNAISAKIAKVSIDGKNAQTAISESQHANPGIQALQTGAATNLNKGGTSAPDEETKKSLRKLVMDRAKGLMSLGSTRRTSSEQAQNQAVQQVDVGNPQPPAVNPPIPPRGGKGGSPGQSQVNSPGNDAKPT